MDQPGPSECPPHTIIQGYQDAPCGSLLCLSQGEQLCCKAKAELMINYVHPCLSSLQQETQPWQLRGSCASFWTLEPHISQCLESCTNILALLRCYSKGAEGCCTLLCALAHTLTSLLFAPEKWDGPSAQRCLVCPGRGWQLVGCAGWMYWPGGLHAKGPVLLVFLIWVQLPLGKQLGKFNWIWFKGSLQYRRWVFTNVSCKTSWDWGGEVDGCLGSQRSE